MRELLFSVTKKDLDINFFSGTGAGGQHRNKHQNCVRMFHKESGARSVGQSHREKQVNLREAFNTLIKHPRFRIWHNIKTQEVLEGKTIEKKVEEMVTPESIKTEYKENGKWVEA